MLLECGLWFSMSGVELRSYSYEPATLCWCWKSKANIFSSYAADIAQFKKCVGRWPQRDSMIRVETVTGPEVTASSFQTSRLNVKRTLTSETDAFAHVHCLEYCYSFILTLQIPYFGVPNPGHGPVCTLLGTGLHISRWAVREWAKLHLYLQPLPLFTSPPELCLLSYHQRDNKYNALKSSWNHPSYSQSIEKVSSMKLAPGAKKVTNFGLVRIH